MDPIKANARLAITALKASIDIAKHMARKGLMSPDDVEEFASSITAHLYESKDQSAAHAEVREWIEALIADALADIKRTAQEHWRG